MAIQTLDTAKLAAATGNLYETVSVISKRARQLSSKTKAELDGRLSYFEDLSLDPAEEMRSNEDQLRISLEYERQPQAHARRHRGVGGRRAVLPQPQHRLGGVAHVGESVRR